MNYDKSILEEAHSIVNERDEDKNRRYGDFDECMDRVARLASILTGKELSVDDAYWILVSLKLSRESHYHKRDNMVDLVGYLQGLHSYREKNLPDEEKLDEEALERRMNIIGQNGNTGEHYDTEYDGIAVRIINPKPEDPTIAANLEAERDNYGPSFFD